MRRVAAYSAHTRVCGKDIRDGALNDGSEVSGQGVDGRYGWPVSSLDATLTQGESRPGPYLSPDTLGPLLHGITSL